jgi:uncharacterized protein (TIGR03083 family)
MAPIATCELFPILDEKLIQFLRSLSADDWKRSATPRWSVKDVAGHLLDGNLRRLSMARDGFFGEPFAGDSSDELIAFLMGLTADWVKAMKRLSPEVLIALLAASGKEVSNYFDSLDAHGRAAFAVSWAGEETSENWFDVARDYTEKWHHQQQIREAVGRSTDELMERRLYFPVLDTFMRVLPYAYRDVVATEGTTLAVEVQGDAGGNWLLTRHGSKWELSGEVAACPDARVRIPQTSAWKLFTKGLSPGAIRQGLHREGDERLTEPMTRVIAIVG